MSTEEALQKIAEFDHPFTVGEGGSLADARDVYAPEVYHDPDGDIEIISDEWEALTGFTGQYSYNGAVMHASEYLGGGLARHVLDNPGTYVVVAVEVLDDHDHPAGWAILRKKEG